MIGRRTKIYAVMSILFCHIITMEQNVMAAEQNSKHHSNHQGIYLGGGLGYRHMIHSYEIDDGNIRGDKKSDDIIGKVILGYGHDVSEANLSVELFVDFTTSKRGIINNGEGIFMTCINDGVQPCIAIKIGTNVTPNLFIHLGFGCGYAKQLIDMPETDTIPVLKEDGSFEINTTPHVYNNIGPIAIIGGDVKLSHGWKVRFDFTYRFSSEKKTNDLTAKPNFGPSMGITLCHHIKFGG